MISKGFTSFKTPAVPIIQSLAQFNNSSLAIIINGMEFSSSSNELSLSDSKNGKLGFIVPTNADQLLHHVDNFCFNTAFLAKKTLYLNLQWVSAHDILSSG